MNTKEQTGERVRSSTSSRQNQKIDAQSLENVRVYYYQGPKAIQQRLKQLDKEWDVERTLELNAASLSLIGVGLSVFVDRRWLILPAVVGTFLIQHAIQGWCPPLPLFRKLGVRTRPEIDREKYALKALRGDFDHAKNASSAMEAVNR